MTFNYTTIRTGTGARMRYVLLAALATAAAVTSHQAGAVTPEQDFANRCAAPGVVLCTGLDSSSDLALGQLQPAADNTIQGAIDTSVKKSGSGSLRFKFRAGVTAANIGGAWEVPLGRTFNVGDVIYVQWSQLMPTACLNNAANYWSSSIKQINIHGPRSTCQGAEYTTVYQSNMPQMYTDCGNGFNTDPTNNILCGTSGANCSGDILIQQGSSLTPSPNGDGYNCHYQNKVQGTGDGSGCFFYPADVWVTYYEKITIGTFGGSNSAVDAFVSVNGGPYKQFQRAAGIYFDTNYDNNFTLIRLETYMTELPKRGKAAPVDSYSWFDELIVSTQPIAPPANTSGSTLPSPTNLRVH